MCSPAAARTSPVDLLPKGAMIPETKVLNEEFDVLQMQDAVAESCYL